jgi:hypothetical protein
MSLLPYYLRGKVKLWYHSSFQRDFKEPEFLPGQHTPQQHIRVIKTAESIFIFIFLKMDGQQLLCRLCQTAETVTGAYQKT